MDARADVVIIGGGIAGLWLLDTLHQVGFSAVVLNKGDLGQGQTIAAQGIIHGGTKYFSDTTVSDLAPMPERWRASLRGMQGPDLSAAPALANSMQMWLPPQLGGAIMARFAEKNMLGNMSLRDAHDRLAILPQGGDGHLFDVDEAVIDVPRVLSVLRELHRERIRQLPAGSKLVFKSRDDGDIDITMGSFAIKAQRIVLTAGSGNESLLSATQLAGVHCQRRPLQQVIVRGMNQPLYLHCIGKNPKPLATITAHPDQNGGWYWYIGGLIAENGVGKSPTDLIKAAKVELARLLPGANFDGAGWATIEVDRAEPGAGGKRPDSATAISKGPIIVGWPTKLALAPVLADKILKMLQDDGLQPEPFDPGPMAEWPLPSVARPPWQEVQTWR